MEKVLLVLGPYDRYNYGDLLFPIIIEKCLHEHYDQINYYSTTAVDLRNVGGKKTESFKLLSSLKPSNEYHLVVAGGESLFVTWGMLCSYIDPEFNKLNLLFRIINKVCGPNIKFKAQNYLGRKWLGGKSYLPLSVSRKDYKNIKSFYYNSLGGSQVSEDIVTSNRKIQSIFNNVDYLSVRDIVTKKLLANTKIVSTLVPDCAILMSKFFNESLLLELVSNKIRDFCKVERNYCFFQVSKSSGINNLEVIVQQLEELNNETQLKICLCPIGIALGHQDQDALELISTRIKVPFVIMDTKVTIYDIMFLISKSKLYMGTSLHGTITAMSFLIPYIGLEVKKLNSYLQTWAVEGLNQVVSFDSMCSAGVEALKIEKEILKNNLLQQALLVEESFKKMY